MERLKSVITATGSFLPEEIVNNSAFLSHTFLQKDGEAVAGTNQRIIEKFQQITGIHERRYA